MTLSGKSGTLNVAENSPLLLAITVGGVVVTGFPLKFIVAAAFGSNPLPIIFTEASLGPKVGLSEMVGIVEGVTVNGFEAELDPWVAVTVLGPLNDEGTIKEAENSPLLLGVTGLLTVVSPNFMVTSGVGSKTSTCDSYRIPIGPDVTLRVMTGTVEDCHFESS